MFRNKLIRIVILSALLQSCGIKGPPLPPINEETIQKQRAGDAASADSTKATDPNKNKK